MNYETVPRDLKTNFNCCSSVGGQNSIIRVDCDVPEQNVYTQHTTNKSIALYYLSDLNMCKMKMFVKTSAKK